MTIIRLGYVAMSEQLQNCSPSQTMTFKRFHGIKDRDAAIRKLEQIAVSNLDHSLRLLRHNKANDVHFYRLSSRLIPLANHEELSDWDFMQALKEPLKEIAAFLQENPMRVDFHPDHFVLLNTQKKETLNTSVKTLAMHYALLRGMAIDPEHRCVLHVGGVYGDKEKALERFIENFGLIAQKLQKMIILENDDTSFTLHDTLYLCEKLGIPLVFDYHHHLAHHADGNWQEQWERVIATWQDSKLPVKMHISSPRSEKEFRAHAEYVDVNMFMEFLDGIKGSIPEIHCMIEAKKKDLALFRLAEGLSKVPGVEQIDGSTFRLQS
ncbi:UV DNA damage repair endonuclease UvsE [Bacillus sp. REN3]|uniref:UV DNA damage repair endonuclease UvsE n=1 Tax=Bacillus sp. REN3 TaxID=2802440 RepID=UPI001AEDDBC3|nr:UV DNA damage repair endonuclease UvsE [Bacillus sp. REN3]